MRQKARILIDPSHSKWVLGGLFNEISQTNLDFFCYPQEIYRLKSLSLFKSIFTVVSLSVRRPPIIFSSLTPFQNFLKLNPFNLNLKFLWLTHFEGVPNKRIIGTLNKANVIFVHSNSIKSNLQELGVVSKIIPVIGAVNPELFIQMSTSGNRIAWVGTAADRKNPEMLLRFALHNSDLNFRVLGKDWQKHLVFRQLKNINNIEYVEIDSKIKSMDFEGCSHYLMLSKVEGGPISLLEALASGLIPVCAPVGIAPELLSKCGYEDQLLGTEYNFATIREKCMKTYSIAHREKVAKYINSYSVTRLSKIIQSEIQKIYT